MFNKQPSFPFQGPSPFSPMFTMQPRPPMPMHMPMLVPQQGFVSTPSPSLDLGAIVKALLASRITPTESIPNVEIDFKGPASVPVREAATNEIAAPTQEIVSKQGTPDRISYRSAP